MATPLFQRDSEADEHWIATSDMMAGLMMVFLLIAVIYIHSFQKKSENIEDVSSNICNEIKRQFEKEKDEWSMSICENGLLVSFHNDAIFDRGLDKLKPEFQNILDVFFPKFMKIVLDNEKDIDELRIEGHTSSEFTSQDKKNSYILNTRLSQKRAYNVMRYVFDLPINNNSIQWMQTNLTAHGMSSSSLIKKNDGLEDPIKSRRVEFRLQTNVKEKFIQEFKSLQP